MRDRSLTSSLDFKTFRDSIQQIRERFKDRSNLGSLPEYLKIFPYTPTILGFKASILGIGRYTAQGPYVTVKTG